MPAHRCCAAPLLVQGAASQNQLSWAQLAGRIGQTPRTGREGYAPLRGAALLQLVQGGFGAEEHERGAAIPVSDETRHPARQLFSCWLLAARCSSL